MSKRAENNILNPKQNEKRNNSREFKDKGEILLNENIDKKNINNVMNDLKQEYDIKKEDIEDIEKLTNSRIICNIGYGGFSTVKLIFNNQQKSYFAMKVVRINKKLFEKIKEKNIFIRILILVNIFNLINYL
jgi:hypothetical protein